MEVTKLEANAAESVVLRLHYEDNSVVDICREIYIYRVKTAPYPDAVSYDQVW